MEGLSSIKIGAEKVRAALPNVSELSASNFEKEVKFESSSYVWFVNRVSTIAENLVRLNQKSSELRRMMIFFLDSDDLARVVKTVKYLSIFENPAISFYHCETGKFFDPSDYRKWFDMKVTEDIRETKVLVDEEALEFGGQDLFRQFEYAHTLIAMSLGRSAPPGWIIDDNILGFKNLIQNLEPILTGAEVSLWSKKGSGKTAVIVGAGPSLKPQMEWIKKNQKKFFWIVADTMLRPFWDAGIQPDLICSLERTDPIVDLLNAGPATEGPTLCGSALLNPKCFEVFRGRHRVFYQGIDFEEFLPFKRSRISTGHSCVGVAMAMASLFSFHRVLLMGIDLCWSAEGESHMKDVTYLNDESYKKMNSSMWRDSIEVENSAGEKVRTNRYWALFRHQFTGWIGLMDRFLKAEVYNLSPSGLSLKGAIPSDLRAVEKFGSETEANFLRAQLSPDAMPKMNFGEVRSRVLSFESKITNSISRLENSMKSGSVLSLVESLKSDQEFKSLVHPTLLPLIDFETRNPGVVSFKEASRFVDDLIKALTLGRATCQSMVSRTSVSDRIFYKA